MDILSIIVGLIFFSYGVIFFSSLIMEKDQKKSKNRAKALNIIWNGITPLVLGALLLVVGFNGYPAVKLFVKNVIFNWDNPLSIE